MKSFKQIFEAETIEIMIRGPQKPVMKLIKKFKGKVDNVTDKGHAIVILPAKNLKDLKDEMSGLGSKGYDLMVPNGDGGFEDAMI
jgi:hypothetical protein